MASNHLVEQLPQPVGEEEELLLGHLVEPFPQHIVEQEPLLGQVEEQLPQHRVEQDSLLKRGQEVEQFSQHLVEQEPLLGPLLAAQRPNTEVFYSTVVPNSPESQGFVFSRWFTL